jgi:ligand-binding SRPBCC domain-containing protein
MIRVEVRSRLRAPADVVWAEATTPAGIARELAPWLRMTMPRRLRHATLATVPLGVTLGRSWLLLGGIVPVEYDDLALIERGPHRFLERSQLASARVWEHERAVSEVAAGCELVDRLGVELRAPLRWLPGVAVIVRALVRAVFVHRHHELRARHGVGPEVFQKA